MASLLTKRVGISAPASGLSWGAVIGIAAAGGAALLGLAIFTIIIILRRKSRRRRLGSSHRRTLSEVSQHSYTGLSEDIPDIEQPSAAHMRRTPYPSFSSPDLFAANSYKDLSRFSSDTKSHDGESTNRSQDSADKYYPDAHLVPLPKKASRKRSNTIGKPNNNSHLSAIIESPRVPSTKSPKNRIKPTLQSSQEPGKAPGELTEPFFLRPVKYNCFPDSRVSNRGSSQSIKREYNVQREKSPNEPHLGDRSISSPSLTTKSPPTVSLDNFEFIHPARRNSRRSQTLSNLYNGSGPSGPLPPLPNLGFEKVRSNRKNHVLKSSAPSSVSSLDSTGSSILKFALSPSMKAAADFSQRHPEMKLGYQIRERETDLKSALIESPPRPRRPDEPLSPFQLRTSPHAATSDTGYFGSRSGSSAPSEFVQVSEAASSRRKSSSEVEQEAWDNFKFPKSNEPRLNTPSPDEAICPKEASKSESGNSSVFNSPRKRSALKGSPNAKTRQHKSKHSVTISLETTILGPDGAKSNSHTDLSNPVESKDAAESMTGSKPKYNDEYNVTTDRSASPCPSSVAGFTSDARPTSVCSLTASSPTLSIPISGQDCRDSAEISINDRGSQDYVEVEDGIRSTKHTTALESVNTSLLFDSHALLRNSENQAGPGTRLSDLSTSRYGSSPESSPVKDAPRRNRYTPNPADSRSSHENWSEVIDLPSPERPAPLSVKRFPETSEPLQPDISLSSLFANYYSTNLPKPEDALSPQASGGTEPTSVKVSDLRDLGMDLVNPMDNRPNLDPQPPTTSRKIELYGLEPFQTTPLRGPRDPPGQSLKSTVKTLRKMGSIIIDDDLLTDGRGTRRYLSIGREASPNLTGTSPDLRGSKFIRHLGGEGTWESHHHNNNNNNGHDYNQRPPPHHSEEKDNGIVAPRQYEYDDKRREDELRSQQAQNLNLNLITAAGAKEADQSGGASNNRQILAAGPPPSLSMMMMMMSKNNNSRKKKNNNTAMYKGSNNDRASREEGEESMTRMYDDDDDE